MRYLLLLLTLFFFSCTDSANKETRVGIQVYNDFPINKAELVAQTISNFYQVKTILLESKLVHKKAYINIKSPRYRADSIIAIQHREIPDSLDYIIGLITKDISTTKNKLPTYKYKDWGVMGLGYCPGNSCVASTFRIKHKKETITFLRLQKVVVHEFGHNLGLPHCKDKKCVMTDAVEKISTIDNANLKLCEKCKNKI